jgi:mycothiol maleylpyruvate isomerase-like protein
MIDSRSSFLAAAARFVAQVAAIPLDALPGPGLGDWDLRSLVGHASRSLVTVETYLDQPAEAVAVPTAADYYLAIAATLGSGDPAIVEGGRQAGAALGADPASYVRDLAVRVDAKLAAYDDGYLLTTIAGGMRLDEYLRTRTFELVVHGLDISAACGADPAFEEEPLVDATTLAAEVAARSGRGPELLLAVTGRASLRADFTVV